MQHVYLIGNAHIDPVWLWRKTEGMSEIMATFRSALDRMKEFDEFVFTSACASYYQWVERADPWMFAEIRQRVAEGRWCIAGGYWVQPDCNIPGGESFARHALYSQHYFLHAFGKTARVGYCVDSFGHNGMMPQLLQKSGMDSYVFMRPDARENPELPDLFHWVSPDGSRVTAARIQMGYGDFRIPDQDKGPYAGEHTAAAKAQMLREKSVKEGLPRMAFFGIGNHGGGPTIEALKALRPIHERNDGIRCAGVNDLFDDLRGSAAAGSLPSVSTDLQHHASGCYAAMSLIKAANRRAECELTAAENLNTLSHLVTGEPLETQRLKEAWQMVLFNQFHDVLAGCCIKEAYDDALTEMGYARAVAQDIMRLSAQRMSWRVATSRANDAPAKKNGWLLWEKQGEGAPVVIFNPHAFPVRTVVQMNARLASVMDTDGRLVASQHVRGPQTNGTDIHNTIFLADVPALGHATYWLAKDTQAPAPASDLLAGDDFLENQYLLVQFDAKSGHIVRFMDKLTGRDLARAPMAGALVIDDTQADTWAHNLFTFDKLMGSFGQAQVRLEETGPVRASIRVRSTYGASTLTQVFQLAQDSRELQVRCEVRLLEKHAIVKLTFPAAADQPRMRYAMPFGFISKACDGREEPGQQWVAMYDEAAGTGLALLNDSKYSFSASGGEMRMTVARSAIYADHFGVRDDLVAYQDQDAIAFAYALRPFAAQDPSDAVAAAQLLNQPVYPVLDTHHPGTLPKVQAGASVSAPNVLLTTLKRAEDGDAFILRLVETAGRAAQAVVRVPLMGFEADLTFGPQEIRTLRVEDDGRYADVLLTELDAAKP